jgi:hypothetical protein
VGVVAEYETIVEPTLSAKGSAVIAVWLLMRPIAPAGGRPSIRRSPGSRCATTDSGWPLG